MPKVTITNRELGLEIVRLRREARQVGNQYKRRLRDAARPLRDAVSASATAAGMHKAAGATSVRQRFSSKGASLRVVVDAKKAPNARPLDHPNAGAFNRHPVHADASKPRSQWHWVNQPARRFFDRGTKAGADAAFKRVEQVLDDISRGLQ